MSLTREQWDLVDELFAEARERTGEVRQRWLEAERGRTDPVVYAEVVSLLAAGDTVGDLPRIGLISNEAPDDWTSLFGAQFGPWRLLGLLGRGGMGEVYLAERADGAYQQQVALKLLKRGVDTDAVLRRFLRERRILGSLNHPNIARLLDAGATPDGRPYLVMERVEGQPITDWCRQHVPDIRGMLELMIGVCEAVHAAHRQQVVHRDLKPSNVLVGEDGTAKLLDFGIAKLIGEDDGETRLTAFGSAPATPQYAAPEQLLGEPVTPASDVFSLGVLLYELLTGALPSWRQNALMAAQAAKDGRPITRPSLAVAKSDEPVWADEARRRDRRRELDGDLDQILLKALNAEPRRRYAAAAELADDLRRYLDGRPVLAQPDSLAYRLRKFVVRNWLPVSAAAAVSTALLLGITLALWQAHVARVASRRAELVKDFLVDVFEEADPEHTQGETMTARSVLDRGERQIQSKLAADPVVQAELYDAFARIQLGLGNNDRALQLAQSALELRRGPFGDRDAAVGRSLLTLGVVYLGRREFVHAIQTLREALQVTAAAEGKAGLQVARVKSALSEVEEEAPDANGGSQLHAQAVSMQREAYETFRRILGPGSPETVHQLLGLAERQLNAADYPAAESSFREAIQRLESAYGPEHTEVAKARLDLGDLLDRMGRFEDSLREHDLAIRVYRKVYGDNHPVLADALFSKSIILAGMQRYDEANADLRETLRIYPPDSYSAAQSHRYLGQNLVMEERYSEANEELLKAVAGMRRVNGDDDFQAYRAVAQEAEARLGLGDAAGAEPMAREAIRHLEQKVGPDAYEDRLPLQILREILFAEHKLQEALALCRRLQALDLSLFGSLENTQVARDDYALAETLLAIGTPEALAEAEPHVDHAVAIDRQKFPGRRLARALLLQARLKLAAGDRSAARESANAAIAEFANAGLDHDPRAGQARELLRQLDRSQARPAGS